MYKLALNIIIAVFVFASCNQTADKTETKVAETEVYNTPPMTVESREVVKTEVKKVTIEEAITLAEQGYRFLDVRTPEEIAEGKIEGALEKNMKAHDFISFVDNLPRNEKLIVYCQAGTRSATACKLFSEAQFTNVVDMTGGYSEWEGYHK